MSQRPTDEELAYESRKVQQNSYSPYSEFRVGAVLEGRQGIYSGTNVENRSYGLTVCAERSAVLCAVSRGEQSFRRLALASPTEQFILPCGACLQVLAEFCDDLPIILTNSKDEISRTTLKKLYPQRF